MKRIYSSRLDLLFVFAILVFLGGCASTGTNYNSSQGEIADIDDLLGLGSEDDESISEDDVMQLLGIAEESASDAVFGTQTPEQMPDELKRDLGTLETQQSDLNAKTQQLESKIADQQSQIASLEQPVTSPGPTATSASAIPRYERDYQDAFMLYKNKRYRDAIEKFEALLSVNASHRLSDNAQYWIAESYYGMGNYQKAIASFEKVFIYTDSNKDDAAQLKIGMCYMKLGDQPKAREELQKLIDNHPTSESVGLARRLLNQIGTAAP